MENTIKGWQYISAIFQRMLDSFERDCLIEPLFIFRGITRRYFSSSKSINEYLQLHPNLDIANKNMPNPQEFLYKKFYNEFIREYKELKNVSPLDTLEHLMKCDNYKYTVPEYIKSGAAIRMQNLKNRSHIDYINYIKNLIDDAKYRFSEYAAENYSDIEILADIQHKGGASCLVDFSNNFLISLWFATQTNKDDKDFHMTLESVIKLGTEFCVNRSCGDHIIFQSEVENLIHLAEEGASREKPDLFALSYFYLEHSNKDLQELNFRQKIDEVHGIFKTEFYDGISKEITSCVVRANKMKDDFGDVPDKKAMRVLKELKPLLSDSEGKDNAKKVCDSIMESMCKVSY